MNSLILIFPTADFFAFPDSFAGVCGFELVGAFFLVSLVLPAGLWTSLEPCCLSDDSSIGG